MTGKKILIDTSVWIDYFRDRSHTFSEKVDNLLSQNDIFVPKIVVAELIQGSKSEREVSAVREFLDAFHIIDQSEQTWVKAGDLSYRLKKRGKRINLADCYIAVMAEEHGCQIFTLDEHFKDIRSAIDVGLIEVDG